MVRGLKSSSFSSFLRCFRHPSRHTSSYSRQSLWLLYSSLVVFLPLVSSRSSTFVSRQAAVQVPAFLFFRQQQPNSTRSNHHHHHRRSFSTTTTTTITDTTDPNKTPTAIMASSAKRDSPSAQRNKEPIWQILESRVFSKNNNNNNNNDDNNNTKKHYRVLEVAAGAGVHTDHFATALVSKNTVKTNFEWYPTDPTMDSMASIDCYVRDNAALVGSNVVKPALPLTLDENGILEAETASALLGESSSSSSSSSLDLIICINMIHISPWEATLGLMKVAGRMLSKDGVLYCYGPYKVGGTAVESNLNFDKNFLKAQNPNWGLRDLEAVCEAAEAEGLVLVEKIEMPANNLSLLFKRK